MTYEPIIVTTLRRFHRRGAPQSLCERIAGGRVCWRMLNDWWNLDGTGALRSTGPASDFELGDPIEGLSISERRIALLQIAEECGEAGRAFPPIATLAEWFGVKPKAVRWDLEHLRQRGRLSWHIVKSDGMPRRFIEAAPP